MKKLLYTLSLLLLTVCLFAQAPQKMSYQAVVRNANNSLVANQNISVRITLLQGSATGAAVYTENHTVQTNANGLMTLEIGGGNAINGIFSSIDWANGPFFIKSEVDPEGGVNYNVTTTQQLMSVPYALYAETSGEHELIDSLQSEMNSLQNVVSRQDSLINALNNQIDTQSDSCVYFIRMNDSYGDGWNESYIVVTTSSGLQNITIPNGNYAMETITVAPGDSVFFFWQPGRFESECSFTISNSSDSIVYSCQDVSALNGMFYFYSGNCPLSIFDKFNILTDQISYQDSVITTLNNQINPTFICGTSTVTDHEGNVYNTVKIGEQCWTRENMRCTTSPSTGTIILDYPTNGHSYSGKKAYYVNNNANNTAEYGLLYNWNAAVDTFNVQYGEVSTNGSMTSEPLVMFSGNRRGVCPQGWHVPSDSEWTQLTNYMGGQRQYVCGNDHSNIAQALSSTYGWNNSENTCAIGNIPAINNVSGFTAVPAGHYLNGGYGGFGSDASFWTATQEIEVHNRRLSYDGANMYGGINSSAFGFSVRCLRDYGIGGAPANNESSSTDNVGGNGLSAYEIWLAAGNTGTEADFLDSLVGPQGPAGQDGAQGPQGETGPQGPQGPQGPAGVGIPQTLTINGMELTISDGNTVQIPTVGGSNGLSAYQVWLNNGNQGSEADFLASLVGPQGPAGQDGAQGPQGETGPQGPQGPQGPAGVGIPQTLTINGMELSISGGNTVQIPTVGGSNGLSAYQVWLNNGNQGTEADFLASLVGPQGETGLQGPAGPQGEQGPAGQDGAQGPQGETGPQGPQGETGPQGPAGQDGVGIAQTLSINGDQLTISDGNTVTLPSNAAQLESLQSDLNSLQNAVSTQDSVINALNNELHPQPAGGRSCPGTPTVTDHEGNVYNTVQIGNQCWTKENLRCTTSPSTGTSIIDEAQSDNSYTGKKAYYVNGDAANTAIYGLLYNWNAAVDTFNTTFGETSMNNSSAHAPSIIFSGNRRGICPQGWHIPSDEEWTQLTDYVGGLDACICGDNSEYISKAVASSTGWDNSTEFCAIGSDQSSNNVTEFTALPTGYHSGGCYDFGRYTNFWCVTQYDNSWAYTRSLHRDAANVSQFYDLKSDAFSVRCLRDAPANNGNGSTNNAGGNSECCTELGARVDNLQSQVSSLQNIVNAQNSQIDSLQQVIAGGGNIRYIVFNANGGDGFMNAQFCPMGVEQHINPLTFTRSGYVFLGWNTAADGTGTFYAKNAPITLTQNITLYAQWSTRVQMQLPDPCGSSTNTNSRTSSSRN